LPISDNYRAGRHFGFDSRCGGFLYSAFAETFRAFWGIDSTTRLRWLFDLLKPCATAGGANNLSQNFKRSFHRDQSFKTKTKVEIISAKIAAGGYSATKLAS
jgi:hypothetical protein